MDDFNREIENERPDRRSRSPSILDESVLDSSRGRSSSSSSSSDSDGEQDVKKKKDFKIPKKSEFATAASEIPEIPPLETSKGRPRVKLDEALLTEIEPCLAGIYTDSKERELATAKMPLVASILASPPQTDNSLLARTDASAKLFVSEQQLQTLHSGILNAINAIAFAKRGMEDPGKSGIYLDYALRFLAWTNQDIIGMRRDRLLRSLKLDPANVLGCHQLPTEKSVNLSARNSEVCPDLIGPAIIRSMKDNQELWQGVLPSSSSKRLVDFFLHTAHSHIASLPVDEWARITQDTWVLETVTHGAKIEFLNRMGPPLSPSSQSGPSYGQTVLQEIRRLVEMKAVREVSLETPVWLSRIFTVPKRDGGHRPIINLSPLNEFIRKRHFKMETFSFVQGNIEPGDFLAKLDLKDAYLSIPIHGDSQKFLGFAMHERRYVFQSLPFGLTSAPRIFTKVLRPVAAHLRSLGIRLVIYLDDILILGSSREEVLRAVALSSLTLTKLGFKINWDKSVTDPVQNLEFLGLTLDTRLNRYLIPERKISQIRTLAGELLSKSHCSCLELSRFIGLVVSVRPSCFLSTLYVRFLQKDLINGLGGSRDYSATVHLSSQSLEDLKWFRSHFSLCAGEPLFPNEISASMSTDASSLGWGAVFDGISTGGRWSREESSLHINVLEMKAALFGLKCFLPKMLGIKGLRLESDNSTVVAYLKKGGGTKDPMLISMSREIWSLAAERKMQIFPVHVPGVQNDAADRASRIFRESEEWSINSDSLAHVFKQLGEPDLDLFASRLNHKLTRYCSWLPDPAASMTDAFSFSWRGLNVYAFPPFNLVARVISKALREQVESMILVAPGWKAQAFFPLLNQWESSQMWVPLTAGTPLLANPSGLPHPCLARGMRLSAWKISPTSGEQPECLKWVSPLF